RVYRMLAKERQSGLKPPSLLTQFLLQLGALIGPPNNPLYPLPIAVEDKAKAMLLYARKGDTSAHKKVLALIRDRKQEAQAKKEKFSAWVTEMEDSLRADEALLEKTRGDTSAIQKRIDGTRRSITQYQQLTADMAQHREVRIKEELAWVQVL